MKQEPKATSGKSRQGISSIRVVQSRNSEDLPVSIQEMIGNKIKGFLIWQVTPQNRYAFYRVLEKVDPEVLIARNYLALTIQKSYLGPRMDLTDKSYKETPEFLSRVNLLLAQMRFATRLQPLVKEMIRAGDGYLRIKKLELENNADPDLEQQVQGEIIDSEILAADAITILSKAAAKDPDKTDQTIMAADLYVVNERDKHEEGGMKIGTIPADEKNPPEIVLPDTDVFHLSWDHEGNQTIDTRGRDTYGIYGRSVYESIELFVKIKLALLRDYVIWFRSGMPRLDVGMEVGDLMDLNRYTGSEEEKIKKALKMVNKVFENFTDSMYYRDNNPDSPTYRKRLPVETDSVFVHTKEAAVQQVGGSTPDAEVINMIEECNRAIAAALGVPMALFGYESAALFGSGRINSKFLSGYGGGLLRSIETETKEFLRKQFIIRKWNSTDSDWENLYFEYDRDDTDEALAVQNVETGKANQVSILATAAMTLYNNQIVTLNEARAIVKDGLAALINLKDVADGNKFKEAPAQTQTLGFMLPESHKVTQAKEDEPVLPENEPKMEKHVHKAIIGSFEEFIENIATAVENGEFHKGGE